MQTGRFEVQNTVGSICGHATRLLNDHREGIALIEQAQFPLGIFAGCRIEEDPTLDQIPMNIGHQRSDVPRRESRRSAAFYILRNLRHRLGNTGVINRIDLSASRTTHLRMG